MSSSSSSYLSSSLCFHLFTLFNLNLFLLPLLFIRTVVYEHLLFLHHPIMVIFSAFSLSITFLLLFIINLLLAFRTSSLFSLKMTHPLHFLFPLTIFISSNNTSTSSLSFTRTHSHTHTHTHTSSILSVCCCFWS